MINNDKNKSLYLDLYYEFHPSLGEWIDTMIQKFCTVSSSGKRNAEL